MSILEEVEKHRKNKGEVERNGLEQITQELMQVTVMEEDSDRPETALMQIDPGSSDVGTKAAQKHNMQNEDLPKSIDNH